MMSNDDDTHERSTTNINTTISGTSKRNMILTPPAAAPATPSTSVAIQNATPSTSVAIQNDHEDVSGIRNPTSKKRRLNVSYEELRSQATDTFNNALASGTRRHYASVFKDLVEFFENKSETKALVYDVRGKGINFSKVRAEHVVSYFEGMQMLDLTGLWVRDWMSNIKKKRSAIKHYRTIYERTESTICSTYRYIYDTKVYEDEMKRWIKGAESAEDQLRKEGRLPALKGKFELSETLYEYIANASFQMPAYVHLFNSFMWQSCGRST